MRVLVAEDDPNMRRGIVEVLEGEGYDAVAASDGEEAWVLFERARPDFVCLDIMMPKLDGYEVCRRIRAQDATIPIVFLSAKSEEIDKVLGLELGADDYVMKPFGVKEFVARVRAISRRCLASRRAVASTTFRFGDLEVLPNELRARRDDETIDLSLREVKLLRCFAAHPDRVLDRDFLFSKCWGIDHYPNSRTLDQHVSKLRKKVEHDPKAPRWITTVHGAGYRYVPGTGT
ncbi:MAG: response regulator transcription factor [Deltaproteobacteria bacterium]